METANAEVIQNAEASTYHCPSMAYPDFSKSLLVATDMSSAVVGAVLLNLDENGREQPVYYANRSLSEAEKNYSTYERGGLAIVSHRRSFDINFCARNSSCLQIMRL